MPRYKKASLSLSINAIVVLILAITMLGLGLGFIRGMFGNAESSFKEMIANEPDPNTPNAATPVTLSKSKVIIPINGDGIVKVSGYNSESYEVTAWPAITCASGSSTVTSTTFNVTFSAGGGVGTVSVFLKPASTAPKTDICRLQFKNATIDPATQSATNQNIIGSTEVTVQLK